MCPKGNVLKVKVPKKSVSSKLNFLNSLVLCHPNYNNQQMATNNQDLLSKLNLIIRQEELLAFEEFTRPQIKFHTIDK